MARPVVNGQQIIDSFVKRPDAVTLLETSTIRPRTVASAHNKPGAHGRASSCEGGNLSEYAYVASARQQCNARGPACVRHRATLACRARVRRIDGLCSARCRAPELLYILGARRLHSRG